jgi:Ni/Co efflux regulator RcnB
MRKLISTTLAAVLFGTAFIAPVSTAAAQTIQFYSSDRGYDDDDRWRWRHRQGRDWDRRGDRDDRRHWRNRHRDRDWDDDDDIAAGILGFAAGALVTGLAASGGSSHVARCEAHYRSYDPYSDTFLGYDGYRHQCML